MVLKITRGLCLLDKTSVYHQRVDITLAYIFQVNLREFPEPWVCDNSSKEGHEVAKSTPYVINSCGGVLWVVQFLWYVQGQNSCRQRKINTGLIKSFRHYHENMMYAVISHLSFHSMRTFRKTRYQRWTIWTWGMAGISGNERMTSWLMGCSLGIRQRSNPLFIGDVTDGQG